MQVLYQLSYSPKYCTGVPESRRLGKQYTARGAFRQIDADTTGPPGQRRGRILSAFCRQGRQFTPHTAPGHQTAQEPHIVTAPQPTAGRRLTAAAWARAQRWATSLGRTTPPAISACLMSFTAFWYAQRAAHVSMIDLMVYRAEGWTVRTGQDLYTMVATHAKLPTTYP